MGGCCCCCCAGLSVRGSVTSEADRVLLEKMGRKLSATLPWAALTTASAAPRALDSAAVCTQN